MRGVTQIGLIVAAASVVAAASLAQSSDQTPPVMPRIQQTQLPAAVTLPGPPQADPDTPRAPLTADEAARIALRRQPTVAGAQSGVAAAQGRTEQARSGLLPSVSVGAGYSYVQQFLTQGGVSAPTAASTGLTSGYQATATLRQLLFDFDRTRAAVRQAAVQEKAAGANLTKVQADLVLQVKQAFYAFAQNTRLVAVNEANVRNQQAHLDLAEARLKSGLGLPVDVVRAQTAVSDAILNLTLARNNAVVSQVLLAQQMGIDPRTPLAAAESGEPDSAPGDIQGLVAQAERKRPELAQALALLESARLGVRIAATQNVPSIAATFGLASRGSDFPPGNDGWTVGATLQWTPFDSGLTSGRVREARANVDAAAAQVQTTRLAIVSDVSQAYLNLKTAEQRIATAASEVANAQESVRLAEGRYRTGVGTFIDVIDAQSALLTAQTNQVNARSSLDQARAALAHAIGAGLPPASAEPRNSAR